MKKYISFYLFICLLLVSFSFYGQTDDIRSDLEKSRLELDDTNNDNEVEKEKQKIVSDTSQLTTATAKQELADSTAKIVATDSLNTSIKATVIEEAVNEPDSMATEYGEMTKEQLAEAIDYFYEGSWQELKAKAKEENKPFFVDFYTDWCRVCKFMDEETFATPQIKNYLISNYIPYKLNAENEFEVAREFQVEFFPTFIIFDADGEVVKRVQGYITQSGMLSIMRNNLPQNEETQYTPFR